MRTNCISIVSAVLVFAGTPVCSQEGQGLDPHRSGWFSGQWQARVELSPGWASHHTDPYNIASSAQGIQRPGLSVLGDYFFKSPSPAGSAASAFSGFRATSGLMVGPRRLAGAVSPSFLPEAQGDIGPMPYVGVGYTDVSNRSGWGFSADFGLMALSPRSAVKLGGVLGGAQSIDDMLRDLRLSPLIQLGVSYSF